jgi:hypothetical protein
VALAEGLVAQRQKNRQARRLQPVVNGVGVVHLEVQQQPAHHLAARRRGNGLVAAVEHGEVHRGLALQLQVHVPVAGEERHEAEVRLVEGGGAGHVPGHDDGVVARDFHGKHGRSPFMKHTDCTYVKY